MGRCGCVLCQNNLSLTIGPHFHTRTNILASKDDYNPTILNAGVMLFRQSHTTKHFFITFHRIRRLWRYNNSDNSIINHMLGLKRITSHNKSIKTALDKEYGVVPSSHWSHLPTSFNRFPLINLCKNNSRPFTQQIAAQRAHVIHFAGIYSGASTINGKIKYCAINRIRQYYRDASHMITLPHTADVFKRPNRDMILISGMFSRYQQST